MNNVKYYISFLVFSDFNASNSFWDKASSWAIFFIRTDIRDIAIVRTNVSPREKQKPKKNSIFAGVSIPMISAIVRIRIPIPAVSHDRA